MSDHQFSFVNIFCKMWKSTVGGFRQPWSGYCKHTDFLFLVLALFKIKQRKYSLNHNTNFFLKYSNGPQCIRPMKRQTKTSYPAKIELLLEWPESMQRHTRQTVAGRDGIIYFARRMFRLLWHDVIKFGDVRFLGPFVGSARLWEST